MKKGDPMILFLGLLLLLVMGIFFSGCPFKKNKGEAMPDIVKAAAKAPVGAVAISRDVSQVSPKGIVHIGKREVSASQLQLMENGIDALYAAAAEDGFGTHATKPYSFWVVFTPPFPCIPSPKHRVPSFVVNGGPQWDGSVYDQYNTKGKGVKDGISVVFAPEMVLSTGNAPDRGQNNGEMYVCPDASVLADAVRYGGDHIFLANFPYTASYHKSGTDGYSYFWCSINHAGDTGHPLLPRGGRCGGPSFADAGPPPDADMTEYPVPAQLADELESIDADPQGVKFRKGIVLRVVE